MNAAPFALSPLAASSRAPFLPLALRSAVPIASLSLSLSLALHRSFPLLSHGLPPGFSPSPPLATFSVGSDRALMRTSFSAFSPSSSSHSYSCSGNSLPPARRRTLLHFLRAFSPPRGSDASNTPSLLLAFSLCPPALSSASLVLAASSAWLLAARLGKRQPPVYYRLHE